MLQNLNVPQKEVKARIKADAKDRADLRQKLDLCVDPKDFIVNVKSQIAQHLKNSDVYVIFDRYHEYSLQSLSNEIPWGRG